jgi:hypothetical protein
MSRLLLGLWNALMQLGEASRFVEVLRVRFERNTGSDVTVTDEAVTDIAFEAVFANPVSGTKQTEVILRIAPAMLRRQDGARMVAHGVLGSLYNYLKFRCQDVAKDAQQAASDIAHLAKYE